MLSELNDNKVIKCTYQIFKRMSFDKEIESLKLNDYIEMNKHHFQYSNLDLQLTNSTMLFLFSK